jgi:hypothetical protein
LECELDGFERFDDGGIGESLHDNVCTQIEWRLKCRTQECIVHTYLDICVCLCVRESKRERERECAQWEGRGVEGKREGGKEGGRGREMEGRR